MTTQTSSLALVLLLAASISACDATVEGGGDGEGGAGGGAEGEGGGAADDGSTDDGPDGAVDDDPATEAPECEGEPPSDCMYGVPSECVDWGDGSGPHWECAPTPLVLAFDREPVRFLAGAGAAFDLTGLGQSVASDWPSSSTPWLALDRDGDGAIADGSELFGSAVRLRSGELARNGFEALAELDENGDGRVDAADPSFAALRLWADADADRVTDAGELTSTGAGARRLVSIDLAYAIDRRCDERDNCEIERARFTWEDASGLHEGDIVDVHLPLRAE